MIKLSYIVFAFLFVGQQYAQQNNKWEFWVSSLDKVANDRLTYHITNDSVTIKDGPYNFIYFAKNHESDKIVFESMLDDRAKIDFRKIGMAFKNDSLKLVYSNLCIIDGLILHFNFEWSDKKMSTTISNLYLAKIEPFVDIINKSVPKKYKIIYDKKELDKEMKNCDKDLILK